MFILDWMNRWVCCTTLASFYNARARACTLRAAPRRGRCLYALRVPRYLCKRYLRARCGAHAAAVPLLPLCAAQNDAAPL